MRAMRVPALMSWRFEIRCADDGVGVDAATVDRRLGVLGELPERATTAGCSGAVCATSGWRRAPAGSRAFATAARSSPGSSRPRATIRSPMSTCATRPAPARLVAGHARHGASGGRPAAGGRRACARSSSQLVQLRPVLEDPTRELLARPALGRGRDRARAGARAGSRATAAVRRRGGGHGPGPRSGDGPPQRAPAVRRLCRERRASAAWSFRSGRAAHESTFAATRGRPGHARPLRRGALRRARGSAARRARAPAAAGRGQGRPQRAQRAPPGRDGRSTPRSTLVLRPIVAAEERRARRAPGPRGRRRAGARPGRPAGAQRRAEGRVRRARQGRLRGPAVSRRRAPLAHDEPSEPEQSVAPQQRLATSRLRPSRARALRFKQSPMRLHPGERRGISLLFDPSVIAPGTPVHVAVDPGLCVALWSDTVPGAGAWRLVASLGQPARRVSAEPGARLSVLAEAGGHVAELDVLVVRHRAQRLGARDRTQGRGRRRSRPTSIRRPASSRSSRAGASSRRSSAQRAARAIQAARPRVPALPDARGRGRREHRLLPGRRSEILARRLAEERPADPAEYAAAVRREAQTLRYRAHERLMRAFLDEESTKAACASSPSAEARGGQRSLLDD